MRCGRRGHRGNGEVWKEGTSGGNGEAWEEEVSLLSLLRLCSWLSPVMVTFVTVCVHAVAIQSVLVI